MHHVQSVALGLFLRSGYERTTVEEIADAAEVSPSSVYRYFGTKEGIVLYDEYVVPWQEAMTTELAEYPPVTAARLAMRSVFNSYFSRGDEVPQELLDLVFSEPALQMALTQQFEVLVNDISGTLAEATGRAETELELRVVARTIIAAMWEAGLYWHNDGYREDLGDLLDRALAVLETELPS
jgi:AcrR family transcriptional regulator